jgi:hypothetical protein
VHYLRYMIRLFWNLVLLAAGVFALYYFKIWPFKENVAGIAYLTDKYCGKKDAPRESAICDCIVRSAEMDMKNRFNEKEFAEIQENRARSAYALQKSIHAIKPDIERCLREQGQEAAWDQFINDLSTLDEPLLKKAKSALDSGAVKLKDLWKDHAAEKAGIDERYR